MPCFWFGVIVTSVKTCCADLCFVFFLFVSSLQKQHDSFRDWLQSKEKQSAESGRGKDLLKDLQKER